MRPLSCLGLLALAGLTGTATAARADVFVRVPFIRVYVGSRPAPVVQPAPVAPASPVVPGDPPPVPIEPVPAPPAVTTPAPVIPRAPTPAEFAATFRPLPGTYEVVLQHPVTCCPVKVCFTLPSCPRKVKVHRRELVFVCPGHTVVVRFLPNGGVRVRG